ncbi:hypothetical protein FQ330_00665 [Agrococcus sediminis]|uniref:Uncharacterized protein n=1 Tax=Agrococcus sediminis TaxID=2599924 RepID=A0A5M8QLH0_9MICO|nr:hypothetical protein [Agrococcus sediminis]KAA6435981.1 hypothetical protein FQ330_00665 [Agrococcus sediminis]
MSNSMLAMPAPRRLALSASRQLERWAMRAQHRDQRRREAMAYEQALEARAQHRLDALARNLLR